MKNLIKIATVVSLLVIACLMISSCGGDNAVQGKGQLDITTTISGTTTPLGGVTFQVSQTNGGAYFDSGTTDATTGKATWTGPVGSIGSHYFFTFTKAGYVTQTYIQSPDLNATGANVKLNVAMVAGP